MNLSNGAQQPLPSVAGLTRQSSIYAMTLDELQNTMRTLGKDYGSLNMDEFLKNIWTAEESQVMSMALGSNNSASITADRVGLQRQGSMTLPRTLSQKTVDEVWRDLVSAGSVPAVGGSGGAVASRQQRQPTLGEITLEEFLVRAGVVREETNPTALSSGPVSNGSNGIAGTNIFYSGLASPSNGSGLSLGFGQPGRSAVSAMTSANAHSSAANVAMTPNGPKPSLPFINGTDMTNPHGLRGGIVNIGDAGINCGLMPGVVGLGGSPVNHLSSDGHGKSGGDLSSVSPVPHVFNGIMRGKKSSAVEKVMERRQRRMIKNRESAARSRARKQAYTLELEAEVASLKKENEELKKRQSEMVHELQNDETLEMINRQQGSKRICLRRTQSGPW